MLEFSFGSKQTSQFFIQFPKSMNSSACSQHSNKMIGIPKWGISIEDCSNEKFKLVLLLRPNRTRPLILQLEDNRNQVLLEMSIRFSIDTFRRYCQLEKFIIHKYS